MYRGRIARTVATRVCGKSLPSIGRDILALGIAYVRHRAGDVQLGAGTGDNDSSDLLWHDNNTGTVAIWLLDGLQALQTGSFGAVPTTG